MVSAPSDSGNSEASQAPSDQGDGMGDNLKTARPKAAADDAGKQGDTQQPHGKFSPQSGAGVDGFKLQSFEIKIDPVSFGLGLLVGYMFLSRGVVCHETLSHISYELKSDFGRGFRLDRRDSGFVHVRSREDDLKLWKTDDKRRARMNPIAWHVLDTTRGAL